MILIKYAKTGYVEEEFHSVFEGCFWQRERGGGDLHMDEWVPHIHAIVFPVMEGRLRARAFLPDRQAMRDLHVKYHEYTRACGLEPERSVYAYRT